MKPSLSVRVRPTTSDDFEAIQDLCRRVYPSVQPWGPEQLASHIRVFPEGQFTAEEVSTGRLLGMVAGLIVLWNDYEFDAAWRDMTARGMFTNHNPSGRTYYGAEIMVDPESRGMGVGRAIYAARRALVERLGLLRIRAGARLRDYHNYANSLSAEEYVRRVTRGEIVDRTLTFQLRQGFHVLAVVGGYLGDDPESRGYAAVIEWINERVAAPDDYAARDAAEARFT
ncbi:MAG: GNAT family N-acetyltransferase [Acidobacteria bacterium]|nr:GNAT family N-acetyltransferase [Acidobacteriota bacterium]MDA1236357.1 GNAT family N-acetyltransferase [Acidobacteriota bacterium]